MATKLTSRKFWLALVGVVFSAVALFGYEVDVEPVIVVDAVLGLYIVVEAIVDAFRR